MLHMGFCRVPFVTYFYWKQQLSQLCKKLNPPLLGKVVKLLPAVNAHSVTL